jgi:hypothetical protein
MLLVRLFYLYFVSGFLGVILVSPVFADAKVDGFFRQDMVTSGMFEGDRHIEEIQPDNSGRETFFISREERRRHPERAVSNSIEPVPPSLRLRRYPLISYPFLPGAWVPGIHYSPRRLRENRINSYQLSSGQQPPPAAVPQPSLVPPTILEPGDSFNINEKYEIESFGLEPEEPEM